MSDDMTIAFMEHMEAMKAEIEETGECSMPPFNFVSAEQGAQIAQALLHA